MSLNNLAVCLSACLLATAVNVRAQELSELSLPPNGMNQRAEVSQWIGLVKVTIAYHSPNVHGPAGRDRADHIWGELVKYGMFDDGFGPSKAAVTIAGHAVGAGNSELYLEIQPTGPWTWILEALTVNSKTENRSVDSSILSLATKSLNNSTVF